MKVEIINTGTEILLGNTINSHLAFIAQEIFPLGLRIQRQVTVPDGDAIRDALATAFKRAEIVFVTGGLGPTTDDLTREITAELLGRELLFDAQIMAAIETRFARRGIEITGRVRRQAMVPSGAVVLPNPNGTAPGLYFPADSARCVPHLFLLPGPPRELIPMFQNYVSSQLHKLLPPTEIECRSYRIAGLAESTVEDKVGEKLLGIEGIELGYCARPGEVVIRCIGTAPMLERAESVVFQELKTRVISTDDRPLEQVVVRLLAERGKKLAVAESCTGGLVSHRITNVPGASEVFLAGYVTYANEPKSRELGVDAKLIERVGAVSGEVASAMAEGALRVSRADCAIATTGIAGPGGGSDEKPVGTVFIGFAMRDGATQIEHHRFSTDRETFKILASQAALDFLRRHLD